MATNTATVEELKKRARTLMATQPVLTLVEAWEFSSVVMEDPAVDRNERLAYAITRDLLMDELERRNRAAFDAWLDANDDSPRAFFL